MQFDGDSSMRCYGCWRCVVVENKDVICERLCHIHPHVVIPWLQKDT